MGAVPGMGHNGGPPLAGGGWASFCWRKAREKALKPPSPAVARIRLRQAEAAGLDYRTLAAILADSGRAPAALMLVAPGAFAGMPAEIVTGKLERLRATLLLGTVGAGWEAGVPATVLAGRFVAYVALSRDLRADLAALAALLTSLRLAPASVVLIGRGDDDRVLSERGRLSMYLDAERYFGHRPAGAAATRIPALTAARRRPEPLLARSR